MYILVVDNWCSPNPQRLGNPLRRMQIQPLSS